MTSSGEQHPAHMRSISPVLTEIGFSFMALTLSAVVYMANFEAACLFLIFEVLSYQKCYSSTCVFVYSIEVATVTTTVFRS